MTAKIKKITNMMKHAIYYEFRNNSYLKGRTAMLPTADVVDSASRLMVHLLNLDANIVCVLFERRKVVLLCFVFFKVDLFLRVWLKNFEPNARGPNI